VSAWYGFWYSRVGLGLMGLFALYSAWELFKNPAACSMTNLSLIICGISSALGNHAASVLVALLAIVFLYLALRPERK